MMKILIVGLGSIARKHIAAIRRLQPDALIFALRSSPSAPQEPGVTSIFTPEDIPADIDFVLISNPTSLHAATIEMFIDSDVPLFIEKPVFDSLKHADLVRRIRDSHRLTYVGCNLRFLDALSALDALLESSDPARRINEVNVYCGSFLPDWRPGQDFRQSYSANPELGGGVHIDLIHEIDYVCWLFGMPREVTKIFRNVSSLGIRAIDYANFSLIYPGFVASVILNYYRRDYRRTIEILFDDDTWTVDLKANTITDSHGDIVYQGNNDFADTYLRQMAYFINLVKNRQTDSDNDIASAFEILKICLD